MKDIVFKELVCNRFMLALEATGLTAKAFGKRVGLSSQQMSNIKIYRNTPSQKAIAKAVSEFGFTTDFFYIGTIAGMRDPTLAEKLQSAQARLKLNI